MKILIALVILSLMPPVVFSQRIQYSRQSVVVNYPDYLRLVSNISGYHHLLSFIGSKPPSINIFDNHLQFVKTKQLPFKIPENSDIKFLLLDDYYYMYVFSPAVQVYNLFRIDRDGEVVVLTEELRNLLTTEFNKTARSLQLTTIDNRLYILTHTYYPDISKLATIVIEVDSLFRAKNRQNLVLDFNGEQERLRQVTMINNHELLVLKTSKAFTRENELELLKIDFFGNTISTRFSSPNNSYASPAFYYHRADSTITVYSTIRTAGYGPNAPPVFISQLDDSLNEKVPVSVIRSNIRSVFASFMLVQSQSPVWLSMVPPRPVVSRNYSAYNYRTDWGNFIHDDLFQTNINRPYVQIPNYTLRNSFYQPSSIRFTMIDQKLKLIKDSLAINDKRSYSIQPEQYAKFTANNTSYLLLGQRFAANKRGLLMVHGDDNELVTTDVRVNDRYDYVLSQLQNTSPGTVIMPYTHRREAGLIRLFIE